MAKILITDDAAFMRMMIRKSLESLGTFEIDEAEHGLEAVEKATATKYDLILLDITMPNLDGIGALKQIMGADPSSICVMCSAMGQEAMVVEAIKVGAKDFIVKPFKPDRIAKMIQTLGLK